MDHRIVCRIKFTSKGHSAFWRHLKLITKAENRYYLFIFQKRRHAGLVSDCFKMTGVIPSQMNRDFQDASGKTVDEVGSEHTQRWT